MYSVLHVKYRLFLSDFNENFIFVTVLKKYSILNFVNIRLVGAELYHADGWTDGWTEMTKPIVAFPNDSSAPNKDPSLLICTSFRLVNNNNNGEKYTKLEAR
jgi:hypothetical protein